MYTPSTKGQRRKEAIMQMLKRDGRITLQDIVERIGCSETTARRDLDYLASTQNVIRTIGGAQLEQSVLLREISFHDKKGLLRLEKEAIARAAASLVQEGDIIGLTGGTTTALIAKELKWKRKITVVTNAVNIAMELADSEDIQIVLTGGVMHSKSYELCGPIAQDTVKRFNIGIMFIGIDGITVENGITTYSESEAEIGRLLISRSKRIIAVFDHSKINKDSLFSYAALSELHECITDEPLELSLQEALHSNKVKVHIANPDSL